MLSSAGQALRVNKSAQVESPKALPGDGVEEGPRLQTRRCDLLNDCKELLGHVDDTKVATSQAESLNGVRDERLSLDGTVANALVLHQHRPSVGAGHFKPLDVCDVLIGRDAIDLSQCLQSEPVGSEQGRDLSTAQASIEEEVEVGQPGWVPGDHGSRRDAGGDPYRVLKLVDGHAVLVGDDVE